MAFRRAPAPEYEISVLQGSGRNGKWPFLMVKKRGVSGNYYREQKEDDARKEWMKSHKSLVSPPNLQKRSEKYEKYVGFFGQDFHFFPEVPVRVFSAHQRV